MDTVRVLDVDWQGNARGAARIVGFYEYTSALQKFDQLVNAATPEELQTIDKIIAKREELAIKTNLSAGMPHPPSALDETPDDPNDAFVRQGLAWLMALARNEVAATTAGFTSKRDPFRYVGATEFELAAYREILLDGLRMHYWALAEDVDLPPARRGRASIHRLVVYGRRVMMMREMLRTSRLLADDATAEQRNEYQVWDANLAAIQADLVREITDYIRRAPTQIAQLPCPSLEEAVRLGIAATPGGPTFVSPASVGAPSKTTTPNATGAAPEAPQNPN